MPHTAHALSAPLGGVRSLVYGRYKMAAHEDWETLIARTAASLLWQVTVHWRASPRLHLVWPFRPSFAECALLIGMSCIQRTLGFVASSGAVQRRPA